MDYKKLVFDLEADSWGSALFLTEERTDELANLTIEIAKCNVGKEGINKLLVLAQVQSNTNDIQEYTFVLSGIFSIAEEILRERQIKSMVSNMGKSLSRLFKDFDDE